MLWLNDAVNAEVMATDPMVTVERIAARGIVKTCGSAAVT